METNQKIFGVYKNGKVREIDLSNYLGGFTSFEAYRQSERTAENRIRVTADVREFLDVLQK